MNTLKNIILSTVLVLPFMVCAGEAININTADKDALMSIKGIGEVFIEKNRDRLRVSEPTE